MSEINYTWDLEDDELTIRIRTEGHYTVDLLPFFLGEIIKAIPLPDAEKIAFIQIEKH